MSNLLRISDLEVGVKNSKQTILSNIDFEIKKDQFVGIVGESGSGKTVTGHAIMGLLAPNLEVKNGKIDYLNTDLLSLTDKQMVSIRGRKISMIFQEPNRALHPIKKIGIQIDEVLKIHSQMNRKQRYERTIELLTEVGLDNPRLIYTKYPHQLSGGMNQRVMIAMAISMNPDILIADEPTTALDVTTQKEILNLLNRLKTELSLSVILISHDLALINQYCEVIYVMYHGKIVEKTMSQDFINNPKHPYTQALIKSYPDIGIKLEKIQPINSEMREYFLSVPRVN